MITASGKQAIITISSLSLFSNGRRPCARQGLRSFFAFGRQAVFFRATAQGIAGVSGRWGHRPLQKTLRSAPCLSLWERCLSGAKAERDNERTSFTPAHRPSQSPAVTALPEGEPSRGDLWSPAQGIAGVPARWGHRPLQELQGGGLVSRRTPSDKKHAVSQAHSVFRFISAPAPVPRTSRPCPAPHPEWGRRSPPAHR